jgi:hypothetical protein
MDENTWWRVRDQSLAIHARTAGFDLAVYNDYPADVQRALRKRAINAAMASIAEEFEDVSGIELTNVKQGVYVISLAPPLAVQYGKWWSPVLYIGIGNVFWRLESHFRDKLFNLMQSLSGATFDFAIAIPSMEGEAMYYKHVEHLMLKYFARRATETGKKLRYPILNSNAGADKAIENPDGWWSRPLKSAGKKRLWLISPTQHSDFQLD